jgi:transposase-like protein
MYRSRRRHSKPEPYWRELIERWKTSGQAIAAFCTDHGVSQATFYSWRKRFAARAPCQTPPAPTFAPVRVVPDPAAEVALPNGLIVRVPATTDPAAVARLVAALGGAAC